MNILDERQAERDRLEAKLDEWTAKLGEFEAQALSLIHI